MKLKTISGSILRLFFGRRVLDGENIVKELDAYGAELDTAGEVIEDVQKQFYPQSATWSIDRWEHELEIAPDAGDSVELRRARVMAKSLGLPPMTWAAMQNIINQFVINKTARVVRIPGQYAFRVHISFYDIPWFFDMCKMVEDAKPTHVQFSPMLLIEGLLVYANALSRRETAIQPELGPLLICGRWPHWSSPGYAVSTAVELDALSVTGTYIFPRIGVSVGSVASPVVAITTLPITGSWLYPRANIKCGISPEIQTIGQAKSTWARVSAEKYAGTYTFPHIGVSTGVTTELTAAVSPYPVSGSWLYPRASIRCGVSPEAQVIGQLASTQIAANTKAMAGIYVFPCAGVSSGIPTMKGAKNTIYVTAGINSYIRCGTYNSGQEVA